MPRDLYRHLARGDTLLADEVATLVRHALDGRPDASLGDMLSLMARRGETASELTGFVRALTEASLRLTHGGDVAEVCGTGGSGFPKFNVSTTVAFVAAAAGIPIVKQASPGSGGRGSLDFLQALGIRTGVSQGEAQDLLDRTGLCLIDVSHAHPQGWRLAGFLTNVLSTNPRSLLRYIFPLANPARVSIQVVGTSSYRSIGVLGQMLRQLGRERAMVVIGYPTLDELSLSGPSVILHVGRHGVDETVVSPQDLKLSEIPFGRVPSGDAATNVKLFHRLTRTGQPRALMDLVSLNAGCVLWCCGKATDLERGYAMSKELLRTGAVREKFEQYQASCPA